MFTEASLDFWIGVKNYMELSISIYRTVGIEFPFIIRSLALFFGGKKKDHLGDSASIALNAQWEGFFSGSLDRNWAINFLVDSMLMLPNTTFGKGSFEQFWAFSWKLLTDFATCKVVILYQNLH